MSALRGALLLGVAVLAGGAAMTIAFGSEGGAWTALFLLFIGVPVLAVSHLVVRQRARLGGVTRQLGGGILLTVGVALVGVEVIALLLFVSAHDAFALALLLGLTGLLAGYSTWLLTTRITKDVEAVRDAVVAVAEGSREEHVEVGSDDEIAELADAANRLSDQLAQSERRRRDLMAAISHDLRTPLSSIRLLVESIEDNVVNGEAPGELLEQMSFHVRSLDNLIGDLFDLSRIESGDISWPVEPVDVQELIEEAVEGMQAQADAAGIRLTAAPSKPPPWALTQPAKIQRVLVNLIENAVRNTPPGGSVTISAERTDETVEVEVADSGVGIEPEERERVFESFVRGAADASRPGEGAGLGLPISRAIVEALGGSIWLAPAEVGTRVRFSLPRTSPPVS